MPDVAISIHYHESARKVEHLTIIGEEIPTSHGFLGMTSFFVNDTFSATKRSVPKR